jgi:uncharacterized protein
MKERHLAPHLLAALADTPVVLLAGARQTGKSTLARELARHAHPARYLTFDEPALLDVAKHDPAGFLAGLSGPVILDEVQRVPELFLPLKAEVDRDRTPGRFLLTGSAQALLLPRLSDYLVGRMEVLTLWPFSRGEIDGRGELFIDRAFSGKPPLDTRGDKPADKKGAETPWVRLGRGGFPEPSLRRDAARRRAWFDSYVATTLQRDIRDLSRIEGISSFPRLLALCAARSGALFNSAEISRSAALPLSTLRRYVSLLESGFLVRFLPAWSGNRGKRLVKAPKMVVTDSALMAHLTGWNGEGEPPEILRGPLLESFAVMELVKQASWSRTRPHLFHFRSLAGQEVDVVLEDARGNLVGVEVKSSGSVGASDLRGLKALAEEAGSRFLGGYLLCGEREPKPLGKKLWALPHEALWG